MHLQTVVIVALVIAGYSAITVGTIAGKVVQISKDVSDIQDRLRRVHPLSRREQQEIQAEDDEDAAFDV